MADPVQGILEVQSDPGGATRIVLDPNAAEISAGQNGESGVLSLNDAGGTAVIQLDADEGDISVVDSYQNTIMMFDGSTATLYVGGGNPDTGNEGDVVVRDATNAERIKLDGGEGDISVNDADGKTVMLFDGSAAKLYVGGGDDGGDGTEGDIAVRDSSNTERIRLDGGRGNIRVRDEDEHTIMLFEGSSAKLYVGGGDDQGGGGEAGSVIVRDDENNKRIKLDGDTAEIRVQDKNAHTVLLFQGSTAKLTIGGGAKKNEGKEGDILVQDSKGRERIRLDASEGKIRVRDEEDHTLLLFDGSVAKLYVGGGAGETDKGKEGDVVVRNAVGTERITLDGGKGNVIVRDESGDQTIKLDGDAGDIVLSNADCAEEFDASESVAPGTVMVIGEDEKLAPCAAGYDRRVAGVVSGAGAYRPGIVLGRRADGRDRPAVALLGRVYCQVDGAYGSIDIGDLLVSSPTPGHAMVAADSSRCSGAVLGKALRAWSGGCGLIPILVTLQ